MGHREQAQFDRAHWRLALLVPLWIAQIAVLLSMIGIFAYRLANSIDELQDNDKSNDDPTLLIVWEGTNVGFSLVSLILTFMEIAKVAAETLTPFSFIFMHVIKLTCSLASLALDIVVYLKFPDGEWSWIGLGMDSGLILFNLFGLIYAIVTYVRVSAFDEYSHPANVKHYGFSNDDTAYPSQTSRLSTYTVDVSSGGRPNPQRNTSSASNTLSLSGLKHSLSIRRQSGTPGMEADLGDGISNQPSIALDNVGRRTSYNHERDTDFDEFLKRHSSTSLKNHVDRALSTEFGWGDSPTSTSTGPMNTPGSDGSIVLGSGIVKAGRPRGDSNSRSTSYDSPLVAVPEGVEEEETQILGGSGKDESVHQGLLANEENRPIGQRQPSPTPSIGKRKRDE